MWQTYVMSPWIEIDIDGEPTGTPELGEWPGVARCEPQADQHVTRLYDNPNAVPLLITCTAETMAAIQAAEADEALGIDVIWAHPTQEQANE